ncbi:predicted protein [Naegleria gruberi]|uniref:Acylamino-acid-releasing enzyme n=1 Tax=Naegleria gruberi TaxID=5762 RepID=D2W090_NAEGR|nr:uncharacterized protein NAEGRDRAFT_74773 [Naegleria gruberi]EFC37532.1 predicted protein [Naegleria gruberi]|eukprot:XP_002670276.1 predicted protein [Naegleria gruberi strain NEG-M]
MSLNVDSQTASRVSQLYEDLKTIPTLSGGLILPSSCIEINCTVSDHQNDKNISLSKQYQLVNDHQVVGSPYPSITPADIHLVSTSPSGKRRAVFKCIASDGKPNANTAALDYQIEIYSNQVLQLRILVKDIHGKVFTDETFGRVSWSSCENKLLYVAEMKQELVKPYWEKYSRTNDKLPENDNPYQYKYDYEAKEDWGEQILLKTPHIYELDILVKKVTHIDLIPATDSAGSPHYLPGSTNFVYTAFERPVRKLGIRFCVQRDAKLFYCDRISVKQIASEYRGPRRPVFSPCGTKLAFLAIENSVNYHNSTSKLVVVNWTTEGAKDSQVIVDIVDEVKCNDEIEAMNTFPGLYNIDLPLSCWSSDSRYIVMNSTWRSVQSIVVIDTQKTSNNVRRLFNSNTYESYVLLSHEPQSKKVLYYKTTPTMPYQIYVGKLDYDSLEVSNITLIEDALSLINTELNDSGIKEKLESISWKVLHIPIEKGSKVYMDCILYIPKGPKSFVNGSGSDKHSLLLIPHGGPHGSCSTIFAARFIYFALCGYAVLLLNYRGSVGFSQSFAGCLPGNIGDMDVKDCYNSYRYILDENVIPVDENSVSVYGGSHGGFLSGHLVGQYPSQFKAGILLNPVINLATIFSESDIPDWCYNESLGNDYYDEACVTKEMLTQMYDRSPIAHVSNVTAAVLLLVGEVDRRVPKEQPREFYHSLRLLGKCKEARMLVYPENDHPIAKPKDDFDSMVSSALFLYKHSN